MDKRIDLKDKIINASLIINDLETLAEDMDENPNVTPEVADRYSLALLGLAKVCEARFNAIDRILPELDMTVYEKDKFYQDDDKRLWKT